MRSKKPLLEKGGQAGLHAAGGFVLSHGIRWEFCLSLSLFEVVFKWFFFEVLLQRVVFWMILR